MSDDTSHDDAGAEVDETSGAVPRARRPFLLMGALLVVLVGVLGIVLALQGDDTAEAPSAGPATDSIAPSGTAAVETTEPSRTSADVSEGSGPDSAEDESPTTTSGIVELEISRGGAAAERPRAFYRRLAESLSTGDLDFALSRLDPAMADLYGLDRCEAALQRASDPTFDIRFFRVVRTEPWRFETDAGTIDIDETTVTEIALFGPRQDGSRNESHLTVLDGEYRWFTFC